MTEGQSVYNEREKIVMKAFMKTTFATLLVCALISIGAYAGDKGKSEKRW